MSNKDVPKRRYRALLRICRHFVRDKRGADRRGAGGLPTSELAFFPCRRRRGYSVSAFSTFPQRVSCRLLELVQEHIGLCAPRMPKLRPRYAEKAVETRPLFTEENSLLHKLRPFAPPPECRTRSPPLSHRGLTGCRVPMKPGCPGGLSS